MAANTLENAARYRKLHPDRTKEAFRKWRESHRDYFRAKSSQRRARKRNSAMGDGKAIAQFYRYVQSAEMIRCFWCRKVVPKRFRQVDHIIPITKGGAHAIFNLAASCANCNKSKNNRLPQDFCGQSFLPFSVLEKAKSAKTTLCLKCRQIQSIDDFPKSKSARSGYKRPCKACIGKSNRRYVAEHRDHLKERERIRRELIISGKTPQRSDRVKRINWTDELIAQLGTVSDEEMAKPAGCSPASVGVKRRSLGIPDYHASLNVWFYCDNCGKLTKRKRSHIRDVNTNWLCSPVCRDIARSTGWTPRHSPESRFAKVVHRRRIRRELATA